MVVTTVDIPKDLLASVDELIRAGKARTRREVILRALSFYQKYNVPNWTGSRIMVGGFRKAFIGKKLMDILGSNLGSEKLYNIGRQWGLSVRDYFTVNSEKDVTDARNYLLALEHLTEMGWGSFSKAGTRIVIGDPVMPRDLIKGYLEAGLDIVLLDLPATEDLLMFEIRKENASKARERRELLETR